VIAFFVFFWYVAERSNYIPAQTSNAITAETLGKNEKEDLSENM
jgi:hypothetical protein